MLALSKAGGRSKAAATQADGAARAAARPLRSQARRAGKAAGRIIIQRSLLRQAAWLLLAVPLLLITITESVGESSTPADAAPVAAAVPADGAANALSQDALVLAGPAVSGVREAAPPVGPLDAAEGARRLGDYDKAAAMLRDLANGQDQQVANDALLQLAVVQIDAGKSKAAADAASELMGRQLDASGRARALFVLGRARRASDDPLGAMAAFDEVIRTAPDFGPYADLQAAYCLAALNDRAGQNARAGKAADAAQARLTRVDALEHQVTASIRLGDTAGALKASDGLLENAGTRAYRAQTLTSKGTIARDGDQRDVAIQAYATVIAELPETPSALAALDALRAMNAADAVAPDEAPAVLYFAGRYSEAAQLLRSAIDGGLTPEKTARARFYLGQALLRLDAMDEGVAQLKRVPDDLPNSDLAARALLRAGRRLEVAGQMEAATNLYQQSAQTLASSPGAQEANARLVYALVMRGANPEALQAALALAESGADGHSKGLGLLWAGKGLTKSGDPTQANSLFARAAELDPDGYGGLRARTILDGDVAGGQGSPTLDLATVQPTTDDAAGLEGWLKAGGIDLATLQREQSSEPGYQRAALLYRVGMPEWAAWEIQDMGVRWAADAGRLYGLARFAADHGDTTLGMRMALAIQKATGGSIASLPRLIQRLIYPLPYADLIAAQAKVRSVDPLLFAGLIRQESTFNPAAKSAANALGLAQVVPSTGQGIASALGKQSFSADDLYRPQTAIEFGVFYLGRQLSQYGGKVFPALAAYNAGGGNVNSWVADFGADDPDLFAERIPFAETSHYVQVVYENYGNYRRLYR